ncbi:hypothetical protein [Vibrio rumoiensis]|uniref:hypothetical protein n=1 Tax=Vibrio rumoiensis TaxID=76258 RepID=UPI000B5CAB84|nr:hypothetical protein [Vibrio rumoiensis]
MPYWWRQVGMDALFNKINGVVFCLDADFGVGGGLVFCEIAAKHGDNNEDNNLSAITNLRIEV